MISNEMLIIRRMAARDIDDIMRIERQSFALPWSREAMESEAVNKAAYYAVAEVGGAVRGYAGTWLVIDEAHITNVAVDPAWRGRGLGEALVRDVIGYCASVDIAIAYLEVRVSNKAAIGLYKKLGFNILSVRKGYYEDNGEDAFVMFAVVEEQAAGI